MTCWRRAATITNPAGTAETKLLARPVAGSAEPSDQRPAICDNSPFDRIATQGPCWAGRLYFDCGADDDLAPESVRLHQLLQHQGVAHQYALVPGDHSRETWRDRFPTSLRYIEHVFQRLAHRPARGRPHGTQTYRSLTPAPRSASRVMSEYRRPACISPPPGSLQLVILSQARRPVEAGDGVSPVEGAKETASARLRTSRRHEPEGARHGPDARGDRAVPPRRVSCI
jgi:hypothetical protein